MSRERDKFIAILNELEKDYHAGNISQEKYISLRKRYIHKIDTLDASNRVRAMRGKNHYSNRHPKREGSPNTYNSKRNNPKYNKHPKYPKQSRNPNYRKSRPKGYYDENGEFHPYKSRPYNDGNLNNFNKAPVNDVPKKTKNKTSIALVAVFTIILLAAFGAGIFMGVFGDGFSLGFEDLLGTGAAINDTAFPIQDQTVNLTDYSSNSSDSSNYSSSSSDYSSYSSSDNSGSSSYDDSGSGSGSSSYDDSSSGSESGSGSESY